MHLFKELDSDWNRVALSLGASSAVRRWRTTSAALAHVTCPSELVQEIRNAGEPSRSDELLSALVRLAATDDLAARTVLQAMIPGMRCLARNLAGLGDAEEVDAVVVACAWTRIRTYPFDRRPRRVAANILLDTRKAALKSGLGRTVQEVPVADVPETWSDPDDDVDLLTVLQDALRMSLVTDDELAVIQRTRCDGASLVAEANSRGIRPEALAKRRARAERRLRLVV